MSLDKFKEFVKTKPSLESYVSKGEKTWQDFYNMYTLYGENNSVWDKYIVKEQTTGTVTLKDMFNMFKNIDMTEVQKQVNSLQKGIGYIENLVKTKEVFLLILFHQYGKENEHHHLCMLRKNFHSKK